MDIRASSAPEKIRNAKRGITLTEMLVVLAIIGILGTLTLGAYNRMQANARVAAATDRVMTLLQQARSLAISQNAIVHIRIQNTWDPATVDAFGNPIPERPGEQYLSIQRFPKTTNAQKVVSTTDVDEASDPHAWSPWPPVKDPSTGEYIINTSAATLNTTTTAPYDNYRLDMCRLDKPLYVGLQGVKGDTTAPTTVLSFYPDGSASAAVTLFVTDDVTFCENQPAPVVYQLVNDNRWDAFNQKVANPVAKQWMRINMIDVYQGGLIKLRRRDPSAP